ncbi:MAG: DUF1819 family protein [Bacteroidetes bacterium]|nr:DUF1819 family protein [Bacteroidota bacterium]
MKINTDINILGGLTNWGLINKFIPKVNQFDQMQEPTGIYSGIRTQKSVQRFERAIRKTLLHFESPDLKNLYTTILAEEGISPDCMLMLFWNTSRNNELFWYLNQEVFFPFFYSGKLMIRKEDVKACILELKEKEPQLKGWSLETIDVVARKYLALLKHFSLVTPTYLKEILHPYYTDRVFILFIYWIKAVEKRSNLLESSWLEYALSERGVFLDRLMKKKYAPYYSFTYTGNSLSVNLLLDYSRIYHAIK